MLFLYLYYYNYIIFCYRRKINRMTTWRSCKDEAPKYDGVYQVLILDDDRQHWRNVYGLYNVKYNSWELWI